MLPTKTSILHACLPLLTSALASLPIFCQTASAVESEYFGVYVKGNSPLGTVTSFESQCGKSVSIINFFNSWTTAHFPASTVEGYRMHGSIPMLTWQPQGDGSDDGNYQLQDILDGNYNTYIDTWAAEIKAWNHPLFLRFAHEMNGGWYPWGYNTNGNTQDQYKAMWRFVHDRFQAKGVTNVTWVWCVSTAYVGGPDVSMFYPGDQYVDWMAMDPYNRGTIRPQAGDSWKELSDLISNTYSVFNSIAPGKPIMIAETGCVEQGGDEGQWFSNALANDLKVNYPRVKAFCYFNILGGVDSLYDNRIDTSTNSLTKFQNAIGLSYYSSAVYSSISNPIQPLKADETSTDTMAPFVSIATPNRASVQAGVQNIININALDKSGIQKVEVYVNGTLKQTENAAPYQYFWNTPAGAGSHYTILVKAYDNSSAHNMATSTISLVTYQ